MHLPIDNILNHRPKVTGCLQQYLEDMTKSLQVIRETAKSNIQKQKQIFKKRYDKKAKKPNFEIGQHVYVTVEHIPVGVSKKLYQIYSGPFYITHKGRNHSYKLRNCVTNKALKKQYTPIGSNTAKTPGTGQILAKGTDSQSQ